MIYDISPLITADLAVFPGDVAFSRQISMDFCKGDALSLSSITSTLHIGAHADAPIHYHPEGKSIDECDLTIYLGPCQVIDVSDFRGEIGEEVLARFDLSTERILFKTKSILNVNQWQDDFSYLSPGVVDHLGTKGVKLVGIDTPSMDFSKSKKLEAHQAFFRNQVAILEGLMLDSVNPGRYTLVALPLKIKGAEASPVRAILIDGF